MKNNPKLKPILQILGMLLFIAIVVLLVWHAFGTMLAGLFHLLIAGKSDQIESYLAQQSQIKGLLCTVLLSVLQVVSIVLPGIAIQIASGALYGWVKAFIACYVGFVAGNLIVFFVVRHMGNQVADIISNNKESGVLKEKMSKFRPTLVVAIANLLPVIPNGIIPYMAAGTPIRYSRFALSLMATCWIQIFFNCLAGSFLMDGEFLFMVFALGIQIVILGLVAWKGNDILYFVNKLLNKV